MNRARPNLASVTTINPDGSRRFLHPADVRGRFTMLRRVAALVLLAVYVALPWIPVNGHPAIFLDVAHRRFHLLGLTLATQDLWLAFFLITGLGFSLFYVTSFFGRAWCGWTCPYTVFLEHIYRRVERLIDGDAPARRRLEDAPWTGSKIFKRVLKQGVFILISAVIAHIFLSYFVSLKQLYAWMQGPPSEHYFAFAVILFLTIALYFAFSWFREQFCIILCPYGRLQSALTDDDTVSIGYDKKRGEPRGKAGAPGAGDCVNCLRCVQVCPTGIDIRDGLQLECIGCAACVDACDAVMEKIERKPGLVRYDSLNGLNGGRTRFIRGRTIAYSILGAVGLAAFAVSALSVKPMNVTATRMKGAPFFMGDGLIRNQFNVQVINKHNAPARFFLELRDAPGIHLNLAGAALEVPALGQASPLAVLTLAQRDYHGPAAVTLAVREDKPGGASIERKLEILGPDIRLQDNDYLNPEHYKK
jgi:cytochrome c oxidase accessory protein FixG